MITPDKHQKFGIPVRIQLTDNSQLMGLIFVHPGTRIMETLCDGKMFFAIRTTDGIKLVNKQHAVHVQLLSIDEIKEKIDIFPDIDFQYIRNNNW
jgi:hypothetical protein